MHIHQFIDFGMLPYCCSAWAADAELRHAPHAAAGCAFSTDPRPVDEKTLEEQNFNARYGPTSPASSAVRKAKIRRREARRAREAVIKSNSIRHRGSDGVSSLLE